MILNILLRCFSGSTNKNCLGFLLVFAVMEFWCQRQLKTDLPDRKLQHKALAV